MKSDKKHESDIKLKPFWNDYLKELLLALWLFLLIYIVLAFADFGTGFEYSGF